MHLHMSICAEFLQNSSQVHFFFPVWASLVLSCAKRLILYRWRDPYPPAIRECY